MSKLYFVHIPKTAGNSVRSALRKINVLTNPGYEKWEREHHFAQKFTERIIGQHLSFNTNTFPTFSDKKEYLDADISFTIVRNPFDLLTSYYSHYIDNSLKKNWIDYGWANVNGYHNFNSFKDFIEFYCNEKPEDWHIPDLSRNIYSQLFDENGKCIVDYAIYYDDLELNINKFLSELSISNGIIKLERKNVSPGKKKTYVDFYDEKLKNMVLKKCQKQIKMFGFGFDEKITKPYINIQTMSI